jgi:hypothetical protein
MTKGGGGEGSIWKGEILHNLRGVVNTSYANELNVGKPFLLKVLAQWKKH